MGVSVVPLCDTSVVAGRLDFAMRHCMAIAMRKQIIIHVGSVKTGSSYLQHLFSVNRKELQEGGVHYPLYLPDSDRFANGNILRNRDCVSDVRSLVESNDNNTLLFSEEGLFVGFLSAIPTYFWEHDVKIVAYIRDPVEVVAAWAAEFSKPYNALHGDVRRIEDNVLLLCERYGEEMQGFLGCVDYAGSENVIIRPYSRALFHNGLLEEDFFHAINRPDISNFIKKSIDGNVNPSFSRKYCDISSMLFEILRRSDRIYEYNEELVTAIDANCQSGDLRSVVDTIYPQVSEIMDKLSWLDGEISQRFLWDPSVYANPKYRNNSDVASVVQVDKQEVEYQLLRLSVARNVSRYEDMDPYSSDLSDDSIFEAIERALQSLEKQHSELLQQRSELLRMRRHVGFL